MNVGKDCTITCFSVHIFIYYILLLTHLLLCLLNGSSLKIGIKLVNSETLKVLTFA